MTPKDLLDLKIGGHSSLRDILNSHLLEGQFSPVNASDMDDTETEQFFSELAQELIDAIKE